ncbi:alpha/beta hydrolase [Photobacterium kagoshimensis]|uniref:alpha/beta hydrolase n=1 Tax=Photobacterium kagoshimensis TaxID=2910242 RepID=UPI003D09A34B
MNKITLALCLSFILTGCNTTSSDPNTFTSQCRYSELLGDPPLTFTVTSVNEARLDGVICSGSLNAFENMLEHFPSVNTFKIKTIPGSADDETNLALSTVIHANGITTHIMSGGMVASGGTDLFLAGVERTAEDSTPQIGVHSWSSSDGRNGNTIPRDDEEHQSYLDYYQTININPDFYWYTLDAAPADNMHWMTVEEMKYFHVLTK